MKTLGTSTVKACKRNILIAHCIHSNSSARRTLEEKKLTSFNNAFLKKFWKTWIKSSMKPFKKRLLLHKSFTRLILQTSIIVLNSPLTNLLMCSIDVKNMQSSQLILQTGKRNSSVGTSLITLQNLALIQEARSSPWSLEVELRSLWNPITFNNRKKDHLKREHFLDVKNKNPTTCTFYWLATNCLENSLPKQYFQLCVVVLLYIFSINNIFYTNESHSTLQSNFIHCALSLWWPRAPAAIHQYHPSDLYKLKTVCMWTF